ncbi:hypothetical protein [Arthrobacter sp. ISL-65]|uniref:hypothetical protein n=1 Tax=Arthrobacter sp. ISL-65 TaxID=2819112 RepID=UPI001BEBE2DE|nr:hypothetical protein [Arthrobacter sp. ISL-65]MBT2546901.1 hypothetical protein [Arthrobacter sp. ISL-65]
MDTNPTDTRLRAAVTDILNAHDLLAVLDLGAPADEYDPEMNDFVALIEEGTAITPEVVAGVWHKWFGDPGEEREPPTPAMAALAADLLAAQLARGT